MEFNIIYSVCSIPNIILPLVGGMLIDKFGYRVIINMCTMVITIG